MTLPMIEVYDITMELRIFHHSGMVASCTVSAGRVGGPCGFGPRVVDEARLERSSTFDRSVSDSDKSGFQQRTSLP